MDSYDVVQPERSSMGNLTSNNQSEPESGPIVGGDGRKGKAVHGETNAGNFQLRLQQAIAAPVHHVPEETDKKHNTTDELEGTNSLSNCNSTLENCDSKIGTTRDNGDFQNQTRQNLQPVTAASEMCSVVNNNIDLLVERRENAQNNSGSNSSNSHDEGVGCANSESTERVVENLTNVNITTQETHQKVINNASSKMLQPTYNKNLLSINDSSNNVATEYKKDDANIASKTVLQGVADSLSTQGAAKHSVRKNDEETVSKELNHIPDSTNCVSSICKDGDVTMPKPVPDVAEQNLQVEETVDSFNKEARCLLEDKDLSIGCLENKTAKNVHKAVDEILQTEEASIGETSPKDDENAVSKELNETPNSASFVSSICKENDVTIEKPVSYVTEQNLQTKETVDSLRKDENAVLGELKQTTDSNNLVSSICKEDVEKQIPEVPEKNFPTKGVDSLSQETRCLLRDTDLSIECEDDKTEENVQKAVEEILQTLEATISNTEIENTPMEVDEVNKSNDLTTCNEIDNAIDESKNPSAKAGKESGGVVQVTHLSVESVKDTHDKAEPTGVTKSVQDVVECVVEGILGPETSDAFSIRETMEQIVTAAMSKQLDRMFDSQIAKKNCKEKPDSRCNTKGLQKLQPVDEFSTSIVDLTEEPNEIEECDENLLFTAINRLATKINFKERSEVGESISTADIEIFEKRLQAILHQVQTLKSTEYLCFYLKLAAKCNNNNNNTESAGESKASGSNMMVDQSEGKKKRVMEVQKIVEGFVNEISKRIVGDIEDKLKILSEIESTWLYLNLPTSGLQQLIKPCNSAFSQTVMWIKTNFQCIPSGAVAKQSVYNGYCNFCERYKLDPLTIVGFGNILKQIYPKVGQRRMGPKSQSRLHYFGIQQCFKLPTPHLPKLSKQSQELSNELSSQMSCHQCCEINLNLYNSHMKKKNKKSSKNKLLMPKKSLDEKDTNDSYRSGKLDGKTIIVHDPLALLSLAVDDKSDIDSSSHRPPEEVFLKCEFESTTSSNKPAGKTRALRSRKSTSINRHSSVRNRKFKQYRHPSVQRLLKKYKSLVLPQEALQANLDPAVVLNNDKVDNWRAEHVRKTVEKLSNLVITQIEGSVNFKVACLCCDDVSELSESQGKQLKNLKDKLSNISVRKLENSSGYEVARTSYNISPPEQAPLPLKQPCDDSTQISRKLSLKRSHDDLAQISGKFPLKQSSDDSFQISKKLNVGAIHFEDEVKFDVSKMRENKHPSVQNLLNRFEGVILPTEVFKSDVEPVIVLDSAEVFEWYAAQLDTLRERLANSGKEKCAVCDEKPEVASNPGGYGMPARHTRAKMMNFCEIESSDEDNDQGDSYQPLSFLDELADGTLQSTIEKVPPEPAVVSAPLDLDSDTTETCRIEPIASVLVEESKNENVQQTQQESLKRPSDEVNNKMGEQKRRKYCSETTVSLHDNRNTEPIVVEETQQPNLQPLPESDTSPTAEANDQYFVCFFCEETTSNMTDFVEHERTHTSCRSCRRRLKNTEIMRLHLIRHCSINSCKRKPFLRLQRIDSVRSAVLKFPDAFKKLKGSAIKLPNILKKASTSRRRNPSTKSKSQSPRTYTSVQASTEPCLKPEATATLDSTAVTYDNNQAPLYHLQAPPPMVQLKSTISNNLNKILLLSNNGTQPQSSNVMYRLYVDNTNGQSSPTVCIAPSDESFNPTLASTGVDCAFNLNPSCSNAELQQPRTFMQIVEAPPPGLPYANPLVMQNDPLVALQHRDHSYHQQPMIQIGNDITNLNNFVFLSNNMPQAQIESVVNGPVEFRTTFEQRFKPPEAETTNQSSNEENSDNGGSTSGQFKIRVKSLNELR